MSTSSAGSTRFAMRGNSRIAYDPGRVETRHKAAFVFLHDLLFDRFVFDPFRKLSIDLPRMVVPEMRGHGASATLANRWYSVAEMADDVIAVLDIEEIDRVHVVGHGMGGVVAFELGIRAPVRCRSITIIEPALYGVLEHDLDRTIVDICQERQSVDRKAADLAYKGLIDQSVDAYAEPRWGTGWRERATRSRLGSIRRHAPSLAGVLPALDSYQTEKFPRGEAPVPTRAFVFEGAAPIDIYVQQRLVASMPHARDGRLPSGDQINKPFGGLSDSDIFDFHATVLSES